MDNLLAHGLSVFMGFFAIMNPVANTAVFVGLTGSLEPAARNKVALKALVSAFLIILMFCMLGKGIFDLFGITIPALRITGGVLVFLVGYQMLHGKQSRMHHIDKTETNDNSESTDIAISPLAIPILAGPGTIATAMNNTATGDVNEIVITVIVFTVLCVITYLCFISGQKILRLLGQGGISVITRLMGLILAVMGTQMLIQGIHDASLMSYL